MEYGQANSINIELQKIARLGNWDGHIHGIKVDCGVGKSKGISMFIEWANENNVKLLVATSTLEDCKDYCDLDYIDGTYINQKHSVIYIDHNTILQSQIIIERREREGNPFNTIIISSARLQNKLKSNDFDMINGRLIIIDEVSGFRTTEQIDLFTMRPIREALEDSAAKTDSAYWKNRFVNVGHTLLNSIDLRAEEALRTGELTAIKGVYSYALYINTSCAEKTLFDIEECFSKTGITKPHSIVQFEYQLKALIEHGAILQVKRNKNDNMNTLYFVSDIWDKLDDRTIVILDATAEFDINYRTVKEKFIWHEFNGGIVEEPNSSIYFVNTGAGKNTLVNPNIAQSIYERKPDGFITFQDRSNDFEFDEAVITGHFTSDSRGTNRFRDCKRIVCYGQVFGNTGIALALTRQELGQYSMSIKDLLDQQTYFDNLKSVLISNTIQALYRGCIRYHNNSSYEFFAYFDWNTCGYWHPKSENDNAYMRTLKDLIYYLEKRKINIINEDSPVPKKRQPNQHDAWQDFAGEDGKNGWYADWLIANNELPSKQSFKRFLKEEPRMNTLSKNTRYMSYFDKTFFKLPDISG